MISPHPVRPVTSDLAPTEPMAADVTADTTCVRCGYNLRGLRSDGRCPECGLRVVATLRKDRVLSHSDVRWVEALASGAALVSISWGLWALLALFVSVIASGDGEAILPLLSTMGPRAWLFAFWRVAWDEWAVPAVVLGGFATLMLFAAGVWRLGAPEPAAEVTERRLAPRRFLRPLAVAVVAFPIVSQWNAFFPYAWLRDLRLLLGIGHQELAWIGAAVSAVLEAMLMIALCGHLRRLSARVLDQKLQRQTSILLSMFAVALTGVAAACVSVALDSDDGIIAIPMAALLVFGFGPGLLWPAYWETFRRAAADARAGDPTAYAGSREAEAGADPPARSPAGA